VRGSQVLLVKQQWKSLEVVKVEQRFGIMFCYFNGRQRESSGERGNWVLVLGADVESGERRDPRRVGGFVNYSVNYSVLSTNNALPLLGE
jgi:hypothetical protein